MAQLQHKVCNENSKGLNSRWTSTKTHCCCLFRQNCSQLRSNDEILHQAIKKELHVYWLRYFAKAWTLVPKKRISKRSEKSILRSGEFLKFARWLARSSISFSPPFWPQDIWTLTQIIIQSQPQRTSRSKWKTKLEMKDLEERRRRRSRPNDNQADVFTAVPSSADVLWWTLFTGTRDGQSAVVILDSVLHYLPCRGRYFRSPQLWVGLRQVMLRGTPTVGVQLWSLGNEVWAGSRTRECIRLGARDGEEGLTRFKAVTVSVELVEGTTDLKHVSKFLLPFVEALWKSHVGSVR